MATINEKMAREIIEADGYYADDPRVMQVVKYENAFGGESWAILYEADVAVDRYQESEFVRNPVVVWAAK